MTAEYFDRWYVDIARSSTRQELFTSHLGLPPEVGPSNLVPLAGLKRIAAAFVLGPDSVLVDLGCGRGGPGMWIARATGAQLIGVDQSAEAVAQAGLRRPLFGLEQRARFAVGTLEDPGLPAGIADAVVCIDTIQFSADGAATAAEIRRLLRPGGRVVATTWEARDRSDEAVSERLRAVDLERWLTAGGLTDVEVIERPEWHETAYQLWSHALTLDPAGDPAMESTIEEARSSVASHDRLRRVMATATAP